MCDFLSPPQKKIISTSSSTHHHVNSKNPPKNRPKINTPHHHPAASSTPDLHIFIYVYMYAAAHARFECGALYKSQQVFTDQVTFYNIHTHTHTLTRNQPASKQAAGSSVPPWPFTRWLDILRCVQFVFFLFRFLFLFFGSIVRRRRKFFLLTRCVFCALGAYGYYFFLNCFVVDIWVCFVCERRCEVVCVLFLRSFTPQKIRETTGITVRFLKKTVSVSPNARISSFYMSTYIFLIII